MQKQQPEMNKAPVGGTTEALSEVTLNANQGNIMRNSNALTIGSTSVRQVGDLYSLNDLHKESGGAEKHKPALFLRNDQAKELLSEMAKGTEMHLLQKTVKGRNGGTYACKELVIAYAAWISAAFHLKVIRVFLGSLVQSVKPAAIGYERISPAQAQDLKEIVEAIVKSGVQGFGETWTRLHRKFRVNSYLELPAANHLEARKYLIAKLPNGVYEGVVFDAEPVKPQDSELLKSAFSLATEVAASAMRTVFDAVIDGKDVSKWDRWMFCLNHDREGKPTIPWAKPIQSDAMVVSMKELPTRILEPNGLMSSDEELANLASACTQRLAARAAFRMKQDSGRLTTV